MPEKISVLIPAFNEANTIAAVIAVAQQTAGVDEVLVISDGSTDQTAPLARACGTKVIELPNNRGKGAALAAGMAAAQNEVLLLLDADLLGLEAPHLAELVQPVLSGRCDMAVGVFAGGRKLTDLAQRLAPFLSGQRCLRRPAFEGLDLSSTGFGAEVAMCRWAIRHRLAVEAVPLPGLTHCLKEEKLGLGRGLLSRFRMYREIMLTLLPEGITMSRSCLPRIKKWLLPPFRKWRLAFFGLLALTLFISTNDLLQIRRAGAEILELPPLPAAPGPRILVVSPHPDDETLGVGGLMREEGTRSEVRVVFLNNGDGFRRALEANPGISTSKLTPERYLEMGRFRQSEALQALQQLGVSRDKVTFLGYPDASLGTVWWEYWDPKKPFTSRFTRRSSVPYTQSYHPGAPYAAPAIISDLENILKDYRPTEVYLPHPEDTHPDHWATTAFVTAAAGELEENDPSWKQPNFYYYIIHRGPWQVSPLLPNSTPLAPPGDMMQGDTRWYRYDLTKEARTAKHEAIASYRTQLKVMREFLFNFDRPNEILARLEELTVPTSGADFRIDGQTADWAGLTSVVTDPRGDTMVRRADPPGDLKAIYLARKGYRYYLRLDTWGNPSLPASYRIALYLLPTPGRQDFRRWVLKVRPGSKTTAKWEQQPGGENTPLPEVAREGNTLEIALPPALLPEKGRLMVGAESRLGYLTIDKTAWRLLNLPGR